MIWQDNKESDFQVNLEGIFERLKALKLPVPDEVKKVAKGSFGELKKSDDGSGELEDKLKKYVCFSQFLEKHFSWKETNIPPQKDIGW